MAAEKYQRQDEIESPTRFLDPMYVTPAFLQQGLAVFYKLSHCLFCLIYYLENTAH